MPVSSEDPTGDAPSTALSLITTAEQSAAPVTTPTPTPPIAKQKQRARDQSTSTPPFIIRPAIHNTAPSSSSKTQLTQGTPVAQSYGTVSTVNNSNYTSSSLMNPPFLTVYNGYLPSIPSSRREASTQNDAPPTTFAAFVGALLFETGQGMSEVDNPAPKPYPNHSTKKRN